VYRGKHVVVLDMEEDEEADEEEADDEEEAGADE
jgi:hypothetical protein